MQQSQYYQQQQPSDPKATFPNPQGTAMQQQQQQSIPQMNQQSQYGAYPPAVNQFNPNPSFTQQHLMQ